MVQAVQLLPLLPSWLLQISGGAITNCLNNKMCLATRDSRA
jgi:hypothetical protein